MWVSPHAVNTGCVHFAGPSSKRLGMLVTGKTSMQANMLTRDLLLMPKYFVVGL